MPVFERRGLQRYELFRIPQIFFKFFKNFFPPRRSSKQPFSEAGCKGTLFSFTSKSFSRFFLNFSEKAVQIAGRDASRAATEPTQNDATAEKVREESYCRKEVTKDWNRTQKWRKPRKSRLVPDHSMWPGSAPEKHLPII